MCCMYVCDPRTQSERQKVRLGRTRGNIKKVQIYKSKDRIFFEVQLHLIFHVQG